MRVLQLMPGPPNDPGNLAVFQRRYPHLFTRLLALGVDLHVVLLGRSPLAAKSLEGSVTSIHQFDPRPSPAPRGTLAIPFLIPQVARLARKLSPDILEGSEPIPATVAGLSGRTLRGCVIVYRRHHGSRDRRGLVLASKVATRLTDKTIVASRADAELAISRDGANPKDIIITPSGAIEQRPVRHDEVIALKDALRIPQDRKVVGVVCRLRPEKGVDTLIAAMDRLPPDVHLVIVGSGPERQHLERMSAGRSNVHLVGHQDDVALWFAASDVIVIPSRSESFGRVTIEAMAARKPILASRVGGLVDAITDGINGLLVTPDDSEALANSLMKVLTDDEYASTLANAARQRFEMRHTMDAMGRSWSQGWKEALSGSGNRTP